MGPWKRRAIGVGIVAVIGVAAIALVPNNPVRLAYERNRARDELEHAASNFCACAMGRNTGDVDAAVRDVGIAIVLGNDEGRVRYLARCKPYYEAAFTAYQAAAKLGVVSDTLVHRDDVDKATKYLAETAAPFRAFWVDAPDPSVPLPPAPVAPAVDITKLRPIHRADERDFEPRVRDQRGLTFGFLRYHEEGRPPDTPTSCTISSTLIATCGATDQHVFIDVRPGARSIAANPNPDGDVQLVDDHGAALGVPDPWEFACSRSDGTVVAYQGGLLAEIRGGKEIRRDPKFVPVTRSTQRVEDWVVFKGGFRGVWPPDYTQPLSVVDLRDGIDAKPMVLSPSESLPKSRYVMPRTYGVCVADSLFVDMDPKLAVGTRDGTWKLHPLDWPMKGRSLDCSGDSATVTDWFPLTVQRCTQSACTPVSLGDYHGDLQDRFAATDKTLYALRDYEGALLVTVIPLEHTDQRKTVFVTGFRDRRYEYSFDVVGGFALITWTATEPYSEPHDWFAIAVGADGKVAAALSNAD